LQTALGLLSITLNRLSRDPRRHSVTAVDAVRPSPAGWRCLHQRVTRIHPPTTDETPMERESKAMYDMYPEWGPAAHDEEHPAHPARRSAPAPGPVQQSMDLRDNGGERPDDN